MENLKKCKMGNRLLRFAVILFLPEYWYNK